MKRHTDTFKMESTSQNSPTWNLTVENSKLYLCIKEKKAVDDNGEALVVEQIGHGRSSKEIWIKFENAKVGRNLPVITFKTTSPFNSEKNLDGTYICVADLITNVMQICPWVTLYKRKRSNGSSDKDNSNKKKKREQIPVDLDISNVEYDMGNLNPVMFKEHFIGQFEVNVLTLTEPPKEYMARRVNNEWVQIIKDKILQQPHLISTILPVLVDPCQVKEVQEFKCESISSYTLWTIGGNHLRSALQEIAKEATLNDLRNVHIRLYCGLKEEQALQLGNLHNGSQQALKPTFQDCVNQALKFKLRSPESVSTQVTQMLRDVEMRDVPKESVGTICSILKYSEENLKMVQKIFTQFAQKSGSMKSIPQTLFRELQGITDANRTSFLTHSYNHGLQKGAVEVKNAKKRNKLQQCFMMIAGINDLDICKRLYPDGISGIEKYLELEMPGAHIPHIFIEYCKKAVDSGDIEVGPKDFQPVIKFNIKIGNIDISNLESVKAVTNKLNQKCLQELIKNEMKIKIDLKNLSENEHTAEDICYEIENDNDNLNCSTCNDSFRVDDSGLPESLDISELQDTDTSISSITESNLETQPPCNQSQDLF
ncbi:uncharacterized protein LOC134725597 [Mytilus trossulus]